MIARRRLAVLVLLAVACGDDAVTTTAPPAVGTSSSTAPATTTQPPSGVVTGSGGFYLADPLAGLDGLSSYTATLTVAFTGSEVGQPREWTSTMVMRVSAGSRELTVTNAGDLDSADPAWIAESSGSTYTLDDEGACQAAVTSPDDSRLLAPASMLPGIIGAVAMGTEAVDGVSADGYGFDAPALGLPTGVAATGEVWVGEQSEVILRYVLTVDGGPEYHGEGIAGIISWDYGLIGADQPLAIELPSDCPAGLIDAPMLPDATNVSDLPGQLGFDTEAEVEEVVAFYQTSGPSFGWTPIGEPLASDTAAILYFDAGSEMVTIHLAAVPSGTNVIIVAARSG